MLSPSLSRSQSMSQRMRHSTNRTTATFVNMTTLTVLFSCYFSSSSSWRMIPTTQAFAPHSSLVVASSSRHRHRHQMQPQRLNAVLSGPVLMADDLEKEEDIVGTGSLRHIRSRNLNLPNDEAQVLSPWTKNPDGSFLLPQQFYPTSSTSPSLSSDIASSSPSSSPRLATKKINKKRSLFAAASSSSSSSTSSLVAADASTSTISSDVDVITTVSTLDAYKHVVAEETNAMVVVRFYAPWCRACRAVAAPFRHLAQQYSSTQPPQRVKFVQVPLTHDNAVLHQGLGIPSLPYVHIYHPEAGLVEEHSLNKKYLSAFTQVLRQYVMDQSCPVEYMSTATTHGDHSVQIVNANEAWTSTTTKPATYYTPVSSSSSSELSESPFPSSLSSSFE